MSNNSTKHNEFAELTLRTSLNLSMPQLMVDKQTNVDGKKILAKHDELKELQNELKQLIAKHHKDGSLDEALNQSHWSVSYNTVMEDAAPFGHSFLSINESLIDMNTGKLHVHVRAVIGYVGGLTWRDLFGLLTTRAKVNDEAERIRTKRNIKQITWPVLPEQIGLLLAQVNHDRRSGVKNQLPLFLPKDDASDLEKNPPTKYQDRTRIDTWLPDPESEGDWLKRTLLDNPSGPRYSVITHNCKCYALGLLKQIGITHAALYDLFIQIPILGHELKDAKLIHSESIETMEWEPTLFNKTLEASKPFQQNYIAYYIKLLWHNSKKSYQAFVGLGFKQISLIVAYGYLVLSALSLILLATIGITGLPLATSLIALIGSNTLIAIVTGVILFSSAIYGMYKQARQFINQWHDNFKLFKPSQSQNEDQDYEHGISQSITKIESIRNEAYDSNRVRMASDEDVKSDPERMVAIGVRR